MSGETTGPLCDTRQDGRSQCPHDCGHPDPHELTRPDLLWKSPNRAFLASGEPRLQTSRVPWPKKPFHLPVAEFEGGSLAFSAGVGRSIDVGTGRWSESSNTYENCEHLITHRPF